MDSTIPGAIDCSDEAKKTVRLRIEIHALAPFTILDLGLSAGLTLELSFAGAIVLVRIGSAPLCDLSIVDTVHCIVVVL